MVTVKCPEKEQITQIKNEFQDSMSSGQCCSFYTFKNKVSIFVSLITLLLVIHFLMFSHSSVQSAHFKCHFSNSGVSSGPQEDMLVYMEMCWSPSAQCNSQLIAKNNITSSGICLISSHTIRFEALHIDMEERNTLMWCQSHSSKILD